MHGSRPHLSIAACLTALAVAGPVRAAPAESSDGRAAMLPLQIEGEINPGWVDKLQAGVAKGLVQGGVQVVGPARVTEATGGVGSCENEKCFKFVSSAVDARFLVKTKIRIEERNYEVALDIIDGTDGSLAASSSESCQMCGLAEVEELVTKQAAALRDKVDALALEPATLAFTTEPPGARIFVDGVEIGAAPFEQELAPGEHTIVAKKPGYIEQSRTVRTVQGVREKIAFDLLPEPTDDGRIDSAGPDWRVPTGWALVGLGSAALAAGVTFLVLDERPYKSRCSGADIDAEGNCRQLYDTMIHGAVSTGGGGVLVISGAAMLISARLRRGKAQAPAHARLRRALLEGRF